ncbi:hypothetical protein HPB47_020209, partial [Ixodes persulcatus]
TRNSASSQATIIDAHRENRTVIVKPQDPTKLIAKLNPLTLSQELDSITPNGVIQIRPNYRLNLLAIDMRDNSSMKTILTLTILLGIKVQTYEAHPRSSAVGIIRDVDKDITETDLKKAISATTPVILVKRLGASETVKLVFATETMPEHVVVGHIRFRVLQYTDKPRQCHKCRRFGHIQAACSHVQRCSRCGGTHDRIDCQADQPRLIELKTDVLALQETYTQKGSQRISPYVEYHSVTAHPDGKSRASLLVKRHILHGEIDLSDLNTTVAEHVAVQLQIADQTIVIISSYIRPAQSWDPDLLRVIRDRCPGPIVWCGDFNANHYAWGSDTTTERGTALLEVTRDLGLRCLNSGAPTFVRANLQKASVLDLTFVSKEISFLWDIEPYTWGSDHLPIRLTPRSGTQPKTRVHNVTNWDSTIRSSTQGVPQGSVLSPLLFNIIMAGLPAALPVGGPYPIHCAIYADDVALWCAGPTRLSTTVRAVLQRALDGTASFLHHADPLLQRLMTRHHSQVGKAVKTFRETIGYPTDVCSIPPPYRDDCQLHVSAEIADLPRRKHVSEVVARSIARRVLRSVALIAAGALVPLWGFGILKSAPSQGARAPAAFGAAVGCDLSFHCISGYTLHFCKYAHPHYHLLLPIPFFSRSPQDDEPDPSMGD